MSRDPNSLDVTAFHKVVEWDEEVGWWEQYGGLNAVKRTMDKFEADLEPEYVRYAETLCREAGWELMWLVKYKLTI